MSDRDYYEILGLTPNADGAMVDAAYWHLVRRYQALASTDPRARYLMDEVNEAYGVLGNPTLRAQYDAFRDDVLIRRGVLKPIPSRPAVGARSDSPAAATGKRLALPSVSLRFWRTYATSAVLAALAFAGAWQGVNLAFVIAALAAGLAFSLTPVLRLQVPDINVALPSLPSVTIPDVKARLTMPSVGESVSRLREAAQPAETDDPVDAGELQASTAAMIARWRSSVGLQNHGSLRAHFEIPSDPSASAPAAEPDAADAGTPVAVVIDILRGARTPVSRLD